MLLAPLSDLVGRAFDQNGLATAYGRVQMADRPDLADVQCNGALQAAKAAGKPPRAVAEAVLNTLKSMPEYAWFADVSLAGPGFINMKLAPAFLEQHIAAQNAHKKFGFTPPQKQTVLIEYCSPNLGKQMHVGHLRNTMLGDSVRRMLAFAGHKVVTDNHLGDWGLPMGQILSEAQYRYPHLPYFQDNYSGVVPDTVPEIDFSELCRIYPAGSQKSKDSPAELERAQKMTAELQRGHAGYRALWQYFMKLSVADMNEKLLEFGVPAFDTYYGESYMDQFIPFILSDMQEKGIVDDIDGAKGVHVATENDKFEIPALIIQKKMGGVTYAATDIATFYQRQKDFDPDTCIILTDFRQELHFERVYRASKRAGYANRMKFVHLMYGTINGHDGKPYKTRSGETPSFSYLIDLAYQKAHQRLIEIELDKKLSQTELNLTKRMIGLASIKFGDLINYRRSDYVFDLDKFVSFEGKTGPYVQYTVVRVNALLAKAAAAGFEPGDFRIDAAQHGAALLALQFPQVLEAALADYAPNILADYVFKLAQSVNSFYQNVPVLTEGDPAKRGASLALLALSGRILTCGLDLLGIKIPAQM